MVRYVLFVLLTLSFILVGCSEREDKPPNLVAPENPATTPHPTTTTPPTTPTLTNAILPVIPNLVRLGHGMPQFLSWSADSQQLAINSSLGVWRYSPQTPDESLTSLEGPTNITFSPDGSHLVGLGPDAFWYIWDAATGEALFSLGAMSVPGSFAFNADGTQVACEVVPAGSFDYLNPDQLVVMDPTSSIPALDMGTIQVWDVGTGEKIADYPSPEQDIRGMLFTLDGTLMVAGSVRNRLIVSTADSGLITNAEYASNDFDIRIHTMNTGEMTTTLTGLTAPPSAVALSPDGLYLAATYGPEIGQPASVSVYVWNTSTSEIVYEIPVARQSLPVALAFSPDGRWLATTERKALDPAAWPIEWVNSVVVWDVTTGEQVETLSDESLIDQEERDYRWLSLLFSPDGRWIAALNEMGTVSVWQVASKEGISFKNFFAAPSDRILFSPDNKALVSAEYRGIVRVWDLMTASQRFAVEMDVFSGMFFMPDGSLVLQSMAYNVPARRYDLASGEEIVNSESQQMIGQIILSPDGTLMAINAGSGAVSLREAANGEMHGAVLAPHQVTCMAFSPDSTVLATGGSDDTIILWDTATRDEIIALAGETGSIFMLSFNRDGTRLISVSTSDMGQNVDGQDNRINNVIRTWDVATGELLMSTTFASLSAGVLSPDGHLLAITENNEDPDLLLIDSGSGDPVAELEGLSTFPLHLTFSSDSNLLAAAGQDGMIYVWDVSSEGGN